MKRLFALTLISFVWAAPAGAVGWLQYGPGDALEARTVTTSATCPGARLDGKSVTMTVRAKADASFPLVCALSVPAGAKSLVVAGQTMVLPVADPTRILVLGDTGCRIKGTALQACNDPKAWPFAGLAKAAAAQKPDLVLHLGDYLYRESPCPANFAGCAGSPYGDNWASWDADFFTPAAPLLAAAPWIVIRGNHEDCYRAGPGFLRLLGPTAYDPAAPCAAIRRHHIRRGKRRYIVKVRCSEEKSDCAACDYNGFGQTTLRSWYWHCRIGLPSES